METLLLGTVPTNLWCNNYTTRTKLSLQPALFQPALSQHVSSPFEPVEYLLDYISRLVEANLPREQLQADLFVIFHHVIQTELLLADGGNNTVIKKVLCKVTSFYL